MITLEQFIDQVKIDYQEESDAFGHFPFQLLANTEDDKIHMAVLDLGGDVVSCYAMAKKYVLEKAKCIYLSVDFPAGGDIHNDFVAVFDIRPNVHVQLIALPYNTKTGNVLPRITESSHLTSIFNQFTGFLLQ